MQLTRSERERAIDAAVKEAFGRIYGQWAKAAMRTTMHTRLVSKHEHLAACLIWRIYYPAN